MKNILQRVNDLSCPDTSAIFLQYLREEKDQGIKGDYDALLFGKRPKTTIYHNDPFAQELSKRLVHIIISSSIGADKCLESGLEPVLGLGDAHEMFENNLEGYLSWLSDKIREETIKSLADNLKNDLESLGIYPGSSFTLDSPEEYNPPEGYFAVYVSSDAFERRQLIFPEACLELPEARIHDKNSQIRRYEQLSKVVKEVLAEMDKRGFKPEFKEVPFEKNTYQGMNFLTGLVHWGPDAGPGLIPGACRPLDPKTGKPIRY